MTELKYFTDKHIPKVVTEQLRKRGVDVLRCEDVGMDMASDPELLEFATQEDRALISFDKDFPQRHDEWQQSGKHHAGIFHIASHLQGEKNIGKLVVELFDFHQLIKGGAGTIQDDIENRLLRIK
jgi:predicted nuclease of predicted toxin-antitoxin system